MSMNKPEKHTSHTLKELLLKKHPERDKTRHRMLLSARIEDAIIEKFGTKIKFAEHIGQKPSVISRWVSGTHNFTHDTMWDIQRILGIDIFREIYESIDHIQTSYSMTEYLPKRPHENLRVVWSKPQSYEDNKTFLEKSIPSEPNNLAM